MEIFFAISNKEVLENWGWTLALGVFTSLIGVMLIANPAISAVTLPLYVGFMLMLHSFWAIGSAFDLKDYGVKGWGISLFIGILGVLFAALLIVRPAIGGLTLVIWTGMALIASGTFNLFLSGYNGLICASDFGLWVPPFSVQTVPLFTVRFVPL